MKYILSIHPVIYITYFFSNSLPVLTLFLVLCFCPKEEMCSKDAP